jgi:hypothetical protein
LQRVSTCRKTLAAWRENSTVDETINRNPSGREQ